MLSYGAVQEDHACNSDSAEEVTWTPRPRPSNVPPFSPMVASVGLECAAAVNLLSMSIKESELDLSLHSMDPSQQAHAAALQTMAPKQVRPSWQSSLEPGYDWVPPVCCLLAGCMRLPSFCGEPGSSSPTFIVGDVSNMTSGQLSSALVSVNLHTWAGLGAVRWPAPCVSVLDTNEASDVLRLWQAAERVAAVLKPPQLLLPERAFSMPNPLPQKQDASSYIKQQSEKLTVAMGKVAVHHHAGMQAAREELEEHARQVASADAAVAAVARVSARCLLAQRCCESKTGQECLGLSHWMSTT